MINIIAAIDKNGLIGSNGDLPWSLPNDLKYFKAATFGHPVIMGRKTWESLPVKPLPGRPNIVMTNDWDWNDNRCIVATNLEYVGSVLKNNNTTRFVIGGSTIFELFMPWTKHLYITHIDHEFEGNTYFPNINWKDWECISDSNWIDKDEKNPYNHKFCIYRRK